jgi:hypothetical protein
MFIRLSAVLEKSESSEFALHTDNLKDYRTILKYPSKIKNGDIILNAGLTNEIPQELYDGKFDQRFLSEIYGIRINKRLGKSTNLNTVYKSACSVAYGKTGLDRVIAIANSVYQQLYFRMNEYTDSYSKKKGIMTYADLTYLEGNDQRKGLVVDVNHSLLYGPFLCHEFAIALGLLLEKEKTRTGLEPFYVMGTVEINGETAQHCWVELRGRDGEKILLDPISNVMQPISEDSVHVKSSNGTKYTIDNGPLILRKNRLIRRLKEI